MPSSDKPGPDVTGTFECPVCKGHHFRTSHHGTPEAEGVCKGQMSMYRGFVSFSGCTFRWLRSNDAAVFKQPTRAT